MDDMTVITTTKPCTRRLLQKLQENIQWARMDFKPSKSHSISIVKGQLTGEWFHLSNGPIPTPTVCSGGGKAEVKALTP